MSSPIKMDLDKFKHVKSDAKSTTLKHPDGHTITIAHGALSKQHQAQLSALSKLGPETQTSDQADQSMHQGMMAKGGMYTTDGGERIPARELQQPNMTKEAQKSKHFSADNPMHKAQAGTSIGQGEDVREGKLDNAKDAAERALRYEQRQPKPKLKGLADGGVADPTGLQGNPDEATEGQSTKDVIPPVHTDSFRGGRDHPVQWQASGGQVKQEPKPYTPPKSTTKYEDKPNQGNGSITHKLADGGVCPMCGGGQPQKLAEGAGDVQSKELHPPVQNNIPGWLSSLGDVVSSVASPSKNSDLDVQADPDDVYAPPAVKEQNKKIAEVQAAKLLTQDQDTQKLKADAGIVDPNAAPPNITPEQQAVNQTNGIAKLAGAPGQPVPPTPPGTSALNPPQPDSDDKTQAGINSTNTDPASLMQSGYSNQVQGAQNEARDIGKLGNQQATTQQAGAEAEANAQRHYQKSFDDLNGERLNFINDIKNGQIDPDQFWHGDADGNGGHSKIMAGIGMILAGFNPAGKPNAAIDFLKSQIDRNVDVQKANLTSKNNLLAANLHQFGNLKDATDMTRIMLNDVVSHNLSMQAAKSQGALAKDAAQKGIGALQSDLAPKFMSFGMKRALMGGLSGMNGPMDDATVQKMMQYAAISDPELGQTLRKAYVPGVGLSSSYTEVPDAVRQKIIATKTTNNYYNQALQMQQQYGGIKGLEMALTHPAERQKINAMADTLHDSIINSIKNRQQDGTLTDSKAAFLKGQVGNSATSIFSSVTANPHIKQLMLDDQQDYDNMLKMYNLPRQQLPGVQGQQQPQGNQQAQALAWAKANPGPKADKILKLLGK